jgi:hypothetical protein
MPRYLSDEYSANDERVERQPIEELRTSKDATERGFAARQEIEQLLKDEKAGAARQRSKKEVTDLLKADKEARKDARNEAKEAKSAPADNVAEEKEMRRARASVRPKGGSGSAGAAFDPEGMKSRFMHYKKGGAVKSASARADGCCIRGKTRA